MLDHMWQRQGVFCPGALPAADALRLYQLRRLGGLAEPQTRCLSWVDALNAYFETYRSADGVRSQRHHPCDGVQLAALQAPLLRSL